jgi:hypothetical protein
MKTQRSALTVFSRTASSEIPCSRCWPTAVTTPNSMTAAAEFGQLCVIRVFGHYEILQILSLTLFEKTPILCALQAIDQDANFAENVNQLILFDF